MPTTITQNGGFPPQGTTIRISVWASMDGQVGIFDLDAFTSALTTGGASAGEIAKAVGDAIDGDMQLIMTNDAKFLGVKVSPLNDAIASVPFLPGIASSTSTGSAGATPMPTQVRGVVTLQCLTQGNAFRGRVYLPFPDYAAMDTDDTPLASYVAACRTVVLDASGVTTVTGAAGDTTLLWSIFHRAPNKAGTTVGGDSTPWVYARGNKLWGTQRRSGNYGRRNAAVIT